MPIAPIVNINGSSKKSLKEDLKKALIKIQEVIPVLSACNPHGRDYQISPSGDYEVARAEHLERMVALQKIETDLFEIYINIENQGK